MLQNLKNIFGSNGDFEGELGSGNSLASNIQKLSSKQISEGIENFYEGKRLGIGRGVHAGKGWNSHGVVTCHSYGCAYNMGADLKVEFL